MLRVKITPATSSPENEAIQFVCVSLENARILRDTELAGMAPGSKGEIYEVMERVIEEETRVVEAVKESPCGGECDCAK